jgi:hypothetical protein
MKHMGHLLFESYTSVISAFELLLLLVDRLSAFGDEALNNDSLEKKRLIIIKKAMFVSLILPCSIGW